MSLKKSYSLLFFPLFVIHYFFSTICCGYFFIENVQKCGSFDQILLFSYNLTQNIKIYPTAVLNNGIKDIPAHEFEDRAAFTPPPYRHHKPTNSKLALSGPTPLLKWMQMYQKIKIKSHA